MLLACLGGTSDARAQAAIPIDVDLPSDEAVFTVDSPVGPIEYFAGRGMRFGRTGLRIGGFSTVEIEREEGESGEIALDSLNFLISYQPIDRLRIFSEIEVDGLLRVRTDDGEVESDPDANFERLYADWSQNDALNLRVGKFQTPIGRWNLVPAEPFTWMATDPVQIDRAFDEHQTGLALFGSFYPGGKQLKYWVYGQVFDPLDPSDDPEPADRSVGGRLEFGDELAGWSVGSSFLASEVDRRWSYLGGLDAEWRRGNLELTSELVIGGGDVPERDLWGVYVQAAYGLRGLHPVLRKLYAVGRYEYFDPTDSGDDSNIGDLGLTWVPKSYLIFKAGYRFTDRETEDVRRGFFGSFSVLF